MYIPPISVTIGQRLNDTIQGDSYNLEPTTCTEQFLPLRLVLKSFFSIPNLLYQTLTYIKSLQSNDVLVTNFIQGTSWKNRRPRHGNRIFFPLTLFFDEYETGNVLGSHAGIHKLGAVYVSVACLPPCYVSILKHIFLVLLFHAADRTQFGNAIIFQPIIEELQFLMTEGIHFNLGVITGDNLGLHQMLGFVESFSATHPCRICTVDTQKLAYMCYEDEQLLRNLTNYTEGLEEKNIQKTGIKEKCVWLQISDFDLFNHVGVDVMHDILEGVAVYIMSFLVNFYVYSLKLFTLEILNGRLFSFNYGPDRSSKPCAIQSISARQCRLKLSSAEMLVFLRYFGLLVGDLVPATEESWSLYLKLRQILDILLSRKMSSEHINLLRTLIAELNELYLHFSKSKLKPKFHFCCHYPRMAEKFGPLCNIWSMRFEAKHRVSKMYARASSNRQNITKSLAIKHQLQLIDVFSCKNICPALK
ncbi:hypothetical protein PPYR_15412, partial [Photinus pyralis]